MITKENLSAICEILNIKVGFRIFVNATHSIFLKNTKTQIKLKIFFFFFENGGHTFVENAMILICAKIQRKMLFGEVGAPESYFWN